MREADRSAWNATECIPTGRDKARPTRNKRKKKQEMTGWVVAAVIIVAVVVVVLFAVYKLFAAIGDIDIGDIDINDCDLKTDGDCGSEL